MIDGVSIFYREAGPKDAPVVLLLHGFPSSSRMFRDLIPRLSDAYHVIAPDYPAFGHSAVPDRSAFGYTFDHLADVVDGLLGQLGIGRFAIYVMDFGAPVGFRLALRHQPAGRDPRLKHLILDAGPHAEFLDWDHATPSRCRRGLCFSPPDQWRCQAVPGSWPP